MKRILILVLSLTIGSAQAAELCRSAAAKVVASSKSGFKLSSTPGHDLSPGDEIPYRQGEVWNSSKTDTVEVYEASRLAPGAPYHEFKAVLMLKKSCKFFQAIDVGDDL